MSSSSSQSTAARHVMRDQEALSAILSHLDTCSERTVEKRPRLFRESFLARAYRTPINCRIGNIHRIAPISSSPVGERKVPEHILETHRKLRRIEYDHWTFEQEREASAMEGIRHHVGGVAEQRNPLFGLRKANALKPPGARFRGLNVTMRADSPSRSARFRANAHMSGLSLSM